jgi:hypothetical protein
VAGSAILLDVVVPDGVVGWPDSCRSLGAGGAADTDEQGVRWQLHAPIIASTGRITKIR